MMSATGRATPSAPAMSLGAGIVNGLRSTSRTEGAVLARVLLVCVPLGVFGALVADGTGAVKLALEAVLFLALLLAVRRYPGRGVIVLVTLLPIQVIVLAAAYRYGLPGGVVRSLGALKEGITVGLTMNAVRCFRRDRRRLDRLDRVALLYLGVLLFYFVMPSVLPGGFGDQPFTVRLYGLRIDGIYVLGMLAARHADIPTRQLRRAATGLIVVGAIVAAGALLETFDTTEWVRLVGSDLQVGNYYANVLGDPITAGYLTTHTSLGGGAVLRAGSFEFSAVILGFCLLAPLALVLQRFVTRTWRTRLALVAALIALGVIVTVTRSAILGASIVVAASVFTGFRRFSPGRVRLVVALFCAALLVAPIVQSTSLAHRVEGAFNGQDTSTHEHGSALDVGVATLVHHPLGLGLGTNPGVGNRFDVSASVTSEDAYLQVGDELGVVEMVIFVWLLLELVLCLRAASGRPGTRQDLAAAMYAAGLGLAAGGFFLHVWLDFATSVPFWVIAGAALSARREADHGLPDPSVHTRSVALVATSG